MNDLLIRRLSNYMTEENIIVRDVSIIDKVCKFLKVIHKIKQNPNKIITLGVRDKIVDSESVMWYNHYNSHSTKQSGLGLKSNSKLELNKISEEEPTVIDETTDININKSFIRNEMNFEEIILEHKDEVKRMNNIITSLVKEKTKLKDELIMKNKCNIITQSKKVENGTQTDQVINMTPQYNTLMCEIVSVRSDLTRMLEPYDEIQFTSNLLDIGFMASIVKAIKYLTSKVEVKRTQCEVESDDESIMDPKDEDDHEYDSD